MLKTLNLKIGTTKNRKFHIENLFDVRHMSAEEATDYLLSDESIDDTLFRYDTSYDASLQIVTMSTDNKNEKFKIVTRVYESDKITEHSNFNNFLDAETFHNEMITKYIV